MTSDWDAFAKILTFPFSRKAENEENDLASPGLLIFQFSELTLKYFVIKERTVCYHNCCKPQ